jgi:hypothetical protein
LRFANWKVGGAAARRAALLCVALVPLLAAACGSGRPKPAPNRHGDVSGARAQIGLFKGIPKFAPPGPGFDASRKLQNETIFEIPITSEVPFVTAVERGMRQAAGVVGAKLVVYPNQGQPAQWAQGIATAICAARQRHHPFRREPRSPRPADRGGGEGGHRCDRAPHDRRGEACQADPAGNIYAVGSRAALNGSTHKGRLRGSPCQRPCQP